MEKKLLKVLLFGVLFLTWNVYAEEYTVTVHYGKEQEQEETIDGEESDWMPGSWDWDEYREDYSDFIVAHYSYFMDGGIDTGSDYADGELEGFYIEPDCQGIRVFNAEGEWKLAGTYEEEFGEDIDIYTCYSTIYTIGDFSGSRGQTHYNTEPDDTGLDYYVGEKLFYGSDAIHLELYEIINDTEDFSFDYEYGYESNYKANISFNMGTYDVFEFDNSFNSIIVIIIGEDGTVKGEGDLIASGDVALIHGDRYLITIKGDLTNDGKIDSRDLLSLRKNLLNDKVDFGYYQSSDTNSDGKIDSRDLLELRRYLLNN